MHSKSVSSCLLVILCLLITAYSVCASTELLVNGSFENGSAVDPWDEGQMPYSWFKWSGNWGWAAWKDQSVSGIQAHSGSRYIVAGGDGNATHGVWGQNIIVTEGIAYSFSVWARTEGWHSNPYATMYVEFKNSADETFLTESYEIFSGTRPYPNQWTQYSLETSPAPAGSQTANFQLRGDLGSPIFDDVSVSVSSKGSDFNNDKRVNVFDQAYFSSCWQKNSNQVGYDPACDLDDSGNIDLLDLNLFVKDWLWFEPPIVVDLDDTVVYQEIDGFGASFTDSSAWLVHEFIGNSAYEQLMTELFDRKLGAGISFIRQPMGTSDMRRRADYSYDDPPDGVSDYALNYFSIAKDQEYIIPVLKKALEINPDLKIMASPWSPPPWMKTNGDFQGGSLIDSDAVYNTYANYFVKFIEAYGSQGIDIYAITVQNEPGLEIGYPSLKMNAVEQANLIKRVGAKFQSKSIDTKIITYDFNWDNVNFALDVLADSQARNYIDGVAWHHYGGDVSSQSIVHDAYPEKTTYFTEGAIGEWLYPEGDFDGALIHAADLLVDTTRNWSKSVVLWNMALHELYKGPIVGNGCWSCFGLVSVNSETKAITKNSPLYALAHASRFLGPGAKRIESSDTTTGNISNVAFVNTDDSVVVYAFNRSTDIKNIQINWEGKSLVYSIPGRAVASITWQNEPNSAVDIWVTTGDKSKLFEKQSTIKFH